MIAIVISFILMSGNPAATAPAAQPMRWVAKANAPDGIREFVNSIPRLKAVAMDRLNNELKTMNDNITDLKKQKSDLAKQKPPMVPGHGGAYETDRDAVAGQRRQMRALTEQIEKAWKDVHAQEQKIKDFDDDDKWLPEPQFTATIGGLGVVGQARIRQVVDRENLLIGEGNFWMWVKGVDTTDLVDDQFVTLPCLRVTGTKKYGTAIGGSKTVFVAEPFDYVPWIELKPDELKVASKPGDSHGKK